LGNEKKLSVLIIAGNEEKNIRDCLESVKWADEIIVVDSESKDKTAEISREYTRKVYINKWEGFAAQRRLSLSKASNEWILSLDADERVSPELKDEIFRTINDTTDFAGYYIPRRNYFLDKIIKSCFWYPDYQLRLFRKDEAAVTDKKVHEGFFVSGETGRLNSDIIHFTHQSIHETFAKVNNYTSLNAEERIDGKKVKAHHLILNPLAAFLNHFISRKGYKDGIYGLMVSLVHSITNMLTYMKIWELQHKKEISHKDGINH
jgi:glycosyltransferase involved in cell wall biosynthesis